MYGQLRYIQFCGFSPRDNMAGVENAETIIDEVKSLFINTGFNTKAKRRMLLSPV